MCKWTACALVFGFFICALAQNTTIVIHELSGTDSAQLGTNTTTIKCDYDYGNDTGVEIKWFYNDTIQIFQWVPNRTDPTPMGPFSSLLEVTNNTIHFKEMTKNLTGDYTCKVSSNEDERSRTQALVAYQPAILVEFYPETSTETLICAAYELYPQPVMTVYGFYVSESNESVPLESAEDGSQVIDTDDEFFNVTKVFRLDQKSLKGSAEFVCNVYIPDTNYNETRYVLYQHPGNESATENPDYSDFATETSINSTTINSTNSTTQGNFAPPSGGPSRSLIMMTITIVIAMSLQR